MPTESEEVSTTPASPWEPGAPSATQPRLAHDRLTQPPHAAAPALAVAFAGGLFVAGVLLPVLVWRRVPASWLRRLGLGVLAAGVLRGVARRRA